MINVTNEQFLKACFGDDYIWAHVTSFHDDPSNISADRRMVCWAGGYHRHTMMQPESNQYYTISTFYADDTGKARRRKALFRATHVIVADDVREKLPVERAEQLPPPSFKLQTSPGSEQWGWILTSPAVERSQVENLLDGLVAQGLAPDGTDPGMKGVTRYVRLPEGVNTKRSKLVNGAPTRCQMLEWHPTRTVTLEQLAIPFNVDLNAERRDARVDGAADLPDHPLLQIPDILKVKEVRSDGRFDVTCPWVEHHTSQSDDGAAIFTNRDGSIGFKCHHGHCQDKTGYDLMQHIEGSKKGFQAHLKTWQVLHQFKDVASIQTPAAAVPDFLSVISPDSTTGSVAPLAAAPNFLAGPAPSADPSETGSFSTPMVAPQPDQMIGYQALIDQLVRTPRTTPEARDLAKAILQSVDSLGHADRLMWWEQVRDHMSWSRADFTKIVDDYRREWYAADQEVVDVYDECVFVGELNQFYNPTKRLFYSVEAYTNTYGHHNDQIRTEALMQGRVEKVDRLDFAPGMPDIFTEDGVRYANTWREHKERSVPGDVQRWLDHFDVLEWGENRKHILQWMAYTIRHPERKINHILMLGGGEGNGKDFLLYPLARAMARDCTTINGDELLRDFDDFLLSTKYLHVNEVELGDRNESRVITNKLKPLGSAPPALLRVNQKGIKPVMVRNIVNVSMTTNSSVPIRLDQGARRYYAIWTHVTVRDPDTGEMTPAWRRYWEDRWYWMRDCEGWRACLNYLLHDVDLSDFDPGSVPVVTDFVRDIQEASEDPLMSVMRELKVLRLGNFASDLVTSSDVLQTLKQVPLLLPGNDVIHQKLPTANIIGKVMRQHGVGVSRRLRYGKVDKSVWVIRDQHKYRGMTEGEIARDYQAQMAKIRNATPLAEVPKTAVP